MQLTFSYRTYRRQFRRPLKTAHGIWRAREGILVRISGEAGEAGFGEIAPLEAFGTESQEEALQFCRAREGRISKEDIDCTPEVLRCCRFACEEAYRMHLGEEKGGGDSSRELAVAALLPAGREAMDVLPGVLARGFTAVKWKIGVYSRREERECFLRLQERIPEGVSVRLDANGALTRHSAEAWMADCSKAGVEFLEQPLAPSEGEALLELAQNAPVALALDESVGGLRDLRHWMERGWPGLFVIKPVLFGSFEDFRNIVRRSACEDSLVFSSAFETSVGMKAAMAWALSFAKDPFPRGLGFGTGGAFSDGLSPAPSPRIKWRDLEEWDLGEVWEEADS